jgi:O-antigen ligase
MIPKPSQPPIDALASFSWGTLPILSLIVSLSLSSLAVWPLQAEKVLRGLYAFVVGLIPISLCFWYYRTLGQFPHDRVYFIYTDALFFLANGIVLLAVILWLVVKAKNGFPLSSSIFLPLTFCLLAFVSVLWSRDWHTSLYISFQILLILLFIFSLWEWPQAWQEILFGFCAALSIQFVTGMVEFIRQTTAFLAPLHLNWPGPTNPSIRGAIVVQLPSGESFLRAYGTLPHPNILGGFALIFLLGPIAFFLRKERPNNLAILLLILGSSLLALTFSRSAWLGLFVFSMVLIWKSKYFDRKRLWSLLFILALSFTITLLPYHQLVQARTINTTSHSEEFSFIGRAWLNGEATKIIREYPLTGVGVGSFIIELGKRAGEGYIVEPAHNILLLAGAELGIPGILLVLALSLSFAYRFVKTEHPNAILAGAMLTGLGTISLFDHYLWTLAPGRLMLGLVIGLFLGQGINDEA